MNNGLRLTTTLWSIQNGDPSALDFVGFTEYGVENNSDNSSELLFILPFSFLRNQLRARTIVGSEITVTYLGSLTRRNTKRVISEISITGATIRLVCGNFSATNKMFLEVLNG